MEVSEPARALFTGRFYLNVLLFSKSEEIPEEILETNLARRS